MKLKPKIILFIFLGLVLILAFIRLLSPEDCWIKDKNGNWVKHGNPSGPAPTGEVNRDMHTIDWIERGMFGATFMLAVATFWLAIEARKSRKQLEKINTPILNVEVEEHLIPDNPKKYVIYALIKVENKGISPALYVVINVERGDSHYEYDASDRRSQVISQPFFLAGDDSKKMVFGGSELRPSGEREWTLITVDFETIYGDKMKRSFVSKHINGKLLTQSENSS
jgi:hypothetical protein